MAGEANIETVKSIYEAFGSGDVAAILDKLADDVDWGTEAAGTDAPWWGVRHNKDEVAKFFEEIAGAIEVRDFTPLAFAAGENEVFALIRFAFTATSTGKEGSMQLVHYWRFRDGKVEYYRGAEDTAQTAATLAG